MKLHTKRGFAAILALIMVLTVVPLAMLFPLAEEKTETVYDGPALNETIVGTVKFQSFNFLGDNSTGEDGTDYKATFYYTDDYFSHSAINENVDAQSVPWYKLDDFGLATLSMDLAVASYSSANKDVLKQTTRTWENSDYSKKDQNAREFLTACGFTDIQTVGYTEAPKSDSIAYVIGSKAIHVYDEATEKNKDFTLVAVGVRGAGYGAEWASNVTVGKEGDGANVYRHEGFDQSAQIVANGVADYVAEKGITTDVKYWVSGFSRAAAVANLTAGYITDNKDDRFHAEQRDVYGYTWECPQAANTSEDALKYKNIHNIVNEMDVVPRVSPSGFEHQRLGVDYVMPYHGNTSSSDNTKYYNRMYEVLKSIATGSAYTGEEDPLIKAVDPNNYPYNRPMTAYTLTAGQLISDALSDELMTNFGTVESKKKSIITGNVKSVLGDKTGNGTCDWYIDDMLNEVLDVFLVSAAWDRGYSNSSNDKISHRTRFVNSFQADMRNVLAYLLDFSGPAFLGLVDSLMNNIGNQLKLSNAGVALAFLNFYNDPKGSYASYNFAVSSSWRGKAKKDVLISEAKTVAVDVVNDMTSGYTNTNITRKQMNASLEKLTALVIDLYADELDWYESQYLGTCLHYMNEILSTHEQETVLSWITSLDDNHINRGYRTLTVPANTNVKLLEFREQFEGPASFDGNAPIVAEYNNGEEFKNLDQRIFAEKQGDNLVIRYPASLDIRADVTTIAEAAIDDLAYQVADYQTTTATEGVSVGAEQYEGLASNIVAYNNITNTTSKTNAKAINNASNEDTVTLGKHDTFMVLANGTSTFDNSASGDANVYDTKLQKRYEVTWQNEDGTVLETDIVNADTVPEFKGEAPVKESTDAADYTFSGWTPEVTAANADTIYTAVFDVAEKVRTGHSLSLKGDIGVNFYYYIPQRYDHDLKLVFNYKGETSEAVLEPMDRQGFNYRGSFNVVAAAMTEPIEAVLTCGDEVIDQQEYSVKAYADSMINNDSSSEKLKRLCKALLNYGGKAQIQFDYRTNDLANSAIGEYAPVSTDDMVVPNFDKESLNSSLEQFGLSYYGASLVLRTETSLKIYFKKLGNFEETVPVSINGQPAEFVSDGDSHVFVKVADIPSSRIANTWTITIGDISFDYSATNYIQNVMNGTNDTLKETVIALYDYYKAAVNYFGY